MQVKNIIMVKIAGLILLTISTSSYAIMSVPYGWYLEGNVGITKIFNESFPKGAGSSNSNVGANANIGYKFMPFFGTEIGYTQYANTNIKNQAGVNAATVRHYAWDLALRGILPLSDNGVEFLGKVGIARAYSRIGIDNSEAAASIGLSGSTSGSTGFYLAAGAQYYFTPEFAIVALWARSQGNGSTGTLDLYSLGISYTTMC